MRYSLCINRHELLGELQVATTAGGEEAPSLLLYCTVLYCIVLYCTLLYCTMHSLRARVMQRARKT